MMSQPIVVIDNLTVQRGDLPLCEGVNLYLSAGQICHLVGMNGAGKTTLLMQIAGLLPVIEGSIRYFNDPKATLSPLYVSHQLGIHPSLTVAQNLTFLLNLYGLCPSLSDIDSALSWVGLGGFESLSSNHLSAGQTRRIALARLYLMTPEITPFWLLDEPFTALDVDMVAKLTCHLRAFTQQGGAVLMTSHQPVEVADHRLDLSDYLV